MFDHKQYIAIVKGYIAFAAGFRHVVVSSGWRLSWPPITGGSSSVYGLIGQIKAVPGKRHELAEILTGMGSMPGCISYVVAIDPNDPDSLWVTEVWESKQAHADSLELPVVQGAIAKGRSLIAGFATRIETDPIGGIGLS